MRFSNNHLDETAGVITPSLVFYRDAIINNIRHLIQLSGGGKRLWWRVDKHKTRELVELQIAMGLNHFICSTISEAEVASAAGAQNVLIIQPLVGPNVSRLIDITLGMPQTQFWVVGDSLVALQQLSYAAKESGIIIPILLDITASAKRSDIPLKELSAFYTKASRLTGLKVRGLYCGDGCAHLHDIKRIQESIYACRMHCDTVVVGGNLSDAKGCEHFSASDVSFVVNPVCFEHIAEPETNETGVILTRVISHPTADTFMLDLGSKGIPFEQSHDGDINGIHAKPMVQGEEYWIWQMESGCEAERPEIGTVLYVLPSNISLSVVLYPDILVAEDGKIVERWETAARARQLNY